MKLGITLTVSIFLHEIPHEVGDFSYLLKQKMSKLSALASQFISAGGAFLGVYLSK
jgi:zinc transporter ZupT